MGYQTAIPPEARTFRAFVVAVWRRPGFKLTLTSLVLLGSLVLQKGVLNLVVTLAIGLPIGLFLGYRHFKRTGEA